MGNGVNRKWAGFMKDVISTNIVKSSIIAYSSVVRHKL